MKLDENSDLFLGGVTADYSVSYSFVKYLSIFKINCPNNFTEYKYTKLQKSKFGMKLCAYTGYYVIGLFDKLVYFVFSIFVNNSYTCFYINIYISFVV